MKTLFAGPWVGEFGWELFCWQGVLRRYVEVMDFDRVVVSGRALNKFLYVDFCDEYISFDPDEYQPDSFFNRGTLENYPMPKKGDVYIPPNHCLTHYTRTLDGQSIWQPKLDQSFVKYGKPSQTSYILLHARYTNKSGSEIRNWDANKFEQIVKAYPDMKFASIGLDIASHHIKGTKDLRGLPLDLLCDYMASAHLIIGPSSGPIHLASLCGLKHLTWGLEHNLYRYKSDWNPHEIEMEYIISNNWDPKVETVKQIMGNLL